MKKELDIIGWREWISFPELGIDKIKAKIDSGARTSSLHAFDVEIYDLDDVQWVRFNVYPNQRNSKGIIICNTKVLEFRKIRSSNGQSEKRPVILTNIELLGKCWPIELTLANRDAMGFRLLLGRESFRKRFLLDAGNSYFGTKNKNKI